MTDKNDTDKKDSKTEVSIVFYVLLLFITFAMASGLAIQNGMFGYEQGTSDFRKWVTAGLFFVGDLALIAGCYHYLNNKYAAAILCVISIFGFASLSGYAAFAFLTGQQSQKDNFIIIEKQIQIAEIRKDKNALPKNYFSKKMEYQSAINQLTKEIQIEQKLTGYVSAGSAGYALIAKATPYSFEQVSLTARVSWSVVFIVGSIAFGGLLGSLKIRNKQAANKSSINLPKPGDVENKGAQEFDVQDNETDSDPKHYKRALEWVNKREPGDGFKISDLRPMISKIKKTQDSIIKKLIDGNQITITKRGTTNRYSRFIETDTPKSIEKPAEILAEPVKKKKSFLKLVGIT
jgi:hypothetical protein